MIQRARLEAQCCHLQAWWPLRNPWASVSWSLKWGCWLCPACLPERPVEEERMRAQTGSWFGRWKYTMHPSIPGGQGTRPRRRRPGCRHHHSASGRPQSNHMVKAATVCRMFTTPRTQSLCVLGWVMGGAPLPHGGDCQMLTWAQHLSQGQPCMLRGYPKTLPPLPSPTCGPGTLTGAPGTQASWPLSPSPLYNGETSRDLGKKGPSHFGPSVMPSKAHILSILRPLPFGCDWHSHPERTRICSADAAHPGLGGCRRTLSKTQYLWGQGIWVRKRAPPPTTTLPMAWLILEKTRDIQGAQREGDLTTWPRMQAAEQEVGSERGDSPLAWKEAHAELSMLGPAGPSVSRYCYCWMDFSQNFPGTWMQVSGRQPSQQQSRLMLPSLHSPGAGSRRQPGRHAPGWNDIHQSYPLLIISHSLSKHLPDPRSHEGLCHRCLSLHLPGDRTADTTEALQKAPSLVLREFAYNKGKPQPTLPPICGFIFGA